MEYTLRVGLQRRRADARRLQRQVEDLARSFLLRSRDGRRSQSAEEDALLELIYEAEHSVWEAVPVLEKVVAAADRMLEGS